MTETNISHKKTIFATLLFVATSIGTAITFLTWNDWFGFRDIVPFAIWTAIYTIPLYIGLRLIGRWLRQSFMIFRLFLATLISFVWAWTVTSLLAFLLGPWFLAFSIPVFWCWLAGATVAFAVQVTPSPQKQLLPLFALPPLVLAGVFALIYVSQPPPVPDMVIVLHPSISRTDERAIWEDGFATTTERGSKLLNGIVSARSTSYHGQPAIRLSFREGTLESQRETIRDRVITMSGVQRVVDVEE